MPLPVNLLHIPIDQMGHFHTYEFIHSAKTTKLPVSVAGFEGMNLYEGKCDVWSIAGLPTNLAQRGIMLVKHVKMMYIISTVKEHLFTFLSLPVPMARWALIHHFLSVCLSSVTPPKFILDQNSYLRIYYR